ncbi:MAG: 2-dehydro-3-deoxygalactonokinase [Acidimicrobiia bacterium]
MRILAIDSGTTSSDVWVVEEGDVLTHERAFGGARDISGGRERVWLSEMIRRLSDAAVEVIPGKWSGIDYAIAFGMITSEYGLLEVPRLRAPISIHEIAAALCQISDPVLPVPLLMVPGIAVETGIDSAYADFMRGEETEVAGLLASSDMHGPILFVSPGSHTKFIVVDSENRIVWSLTTLSGEMLWAISQESIIAELVATEIACPDPGAIERGATVAREQGINRALYVTRLIHQRERWSPSRCAAFAFGAIAGADLQALDAARDRGIDVPGHVIVGGGSTVAPVYRQLLDAADWTDIVEIRPGPFGPIGAWALINENARVLDFDMGGRG